MNGVQGGFLDRFQTLRLNPAQLLILAVVSLVLLGTLLLKLPFASSSVHPISLLEAIFTATSAVCVTGLIVLDTPTDFSVFGQLVILALIQIGGLGYMTAATIMLMVLGKRIGLKERMVIQETLSTFTMEGLTRFIMGLVQFTFIVEFTGAVLLSFRYAQEMVPTKAIYFGIFHSISAFNNAGFALFSNSLVSYRQDPTTNIVTMILIVLGGIGFLVYQDILLYFRRQITTLSVHSKVVLYSTLALILFGWIGFWTLEHQNPDSLQPLSGFDQAVTSLYQSISGRTAGFTTIDGGSLTTPTLYLIVILMFIGGSPGSAAGGIKTTTLAIMAVAMWSTMRGHHEATLFFRRIPSEVIAKAFFLAGTAMILVTGLTLLLLYSEGQDMLRTLFEVTSAAGTVGISTGDAGSRSFSALFSPLGKSVIILAMILGRIGPLAIGITSLGRPGHDRVRFPKGKIMIG